LEEIFKQVYQNPFQILNKFKSDKKEDVNCSLIAEKTKPVLRWLENTNWKPLLKRWN